MGLWIDLMGYPRVVAEQQQTDRGNGRAEKNVDFNADVISAVQDCDVSVWFLFL